MKKGAKAECAPETGCIVWAAVSLASCFAFKAPLFLWIDLLVMLFWAVLPAAAAAAATTGELGGRPVWRKIRKQLLHRRPTCCSVFVVANRGGESVAIFHRR